MYTVYTPFAHHNNSTRVENMFDGKLSTFYHSRENGKNIGIKLKLKEAILFKKLKSWFFFVENLV